MAKGNSDPCSLANLIAEPTRPVHVLDTVGPNGAGSPALNDGGEAISGISHSAAHGTYISGQRPATRAIRAMR
jgi:hypothetical protein